MCTAPSGEFTILRKPWQPSRSPKLCSCVLHTERSNSSKMLNRSSSPAGTQCIGFVTVEYAANRHVSACSLSLLAHMPLAQRRCHSANQSEHLGVAYSAGSPKTKHRVPAKFTCNAGLLQSHQLMYVGFAQWSGCALTMLFASQLMSDHELQMDVGPPQECERV